MAWFRLNDEALDDPRVQLLPPMAFKAAFYKAIDSDGGPFAKHIRPWSGRPSGLVWSEIRSKVFARDNYVCRYCGSRGRRLECDHVVPVSMGGSSDPENLVTACKTCNRSKRARTPEEWRVAQ